MRVHVMGHTQLPFSGIRNLKDSFAKQIAQKFTVVETGLDGEPMIADYTNADRHLLISLLGNLQIFSKVQFKNKKIAYCCTEGTQLCPRNQLELDNVDEIWVPTQWHVSIFQKYFSKPIHVVHAGVDTNIFNINVPASPELSKIPEFKFLCVARFEDQRKNIPQLIRTFLKTFKNEPVRLVLPMTVSERPPLEHPQLIYIHPIFGTQIFAQVYASCDAFVLPTRAEGWGLPICEAMACGLPVITTLYSAVTEYASAETIYPINYELTDVTDRSPSSWLYGLWADPDYDHLAELMRHVYSHREEAKAKGRLASKHICENFNWDLAGQRARELLA